MKRETVLFTSEVQMSREQAANFLRELANKLDGGRVELLQGAEQVAFDLPSALTVEIKLEEESKRRGLKKSFEVELEWLEGDAAQSGPLRLG